MCVCVCVCVCVYVVCKLANVVGGNTKAFFSIATTPRYRGTLCFLH